MRVKIQQFLFGQNHSWAHVGKEIGRGLISLGHGVEFISTDGKDISFIPDDLAPYVRDEPVGVYDMQVSYTAMKNFPQLLNQSFGKNRFGIWNYEFPHLPVGFAKYAERCDLFLPSSQFFYDVCKLNKISESRMKVVPHGVDYDKFFKAEPMKIKTNKKVKILINIAQPHIRKNLPGAFEAIGKAFTKKDDVCIVLKVVDKKVNKLFEVSFSKEFEKFTKKYKNYPEIIQYKNYIPSLESLYKACDISFTMTHAEAFYLPGLEALAAGLVVIAPRYGGQLDYLSNENSLLVDGRMIKAPKNAQYWTDAIDSEMFDPNTDFAAEKLQYAVKNLESLKRDFTKDNETLFKKFNWNAVAQELVNLC